MLKKPPSNQEVYRFMDECRQICIDHEMIFLEAIDNSKELTDEQKNNLITLVLSDIYYVGGLWRSVYMGSIPNDIDVAFKSFEARDYFFGILSKTSIVSSTINSNLIFKSTKNKYPLSFNFRFVSKNPRDLFFYFDFSFNRNYFDKNENIDCVDIDLINKVGELLNTPKSNEHANINMQRLLRFVKEGFSISKRTFIRILHKQVEYKKSFDTGDLESSFILEISNDDSSSESSNEHIISISEYQRLRDRTPAYKYERDTRNVKNVLTKPQN